MYKDLEERKLNSFYSYMGVRKSLKGNGTNLYNTFTKVKTTK